MGLGDAELEKQVIQLRNSLQQRDNEIAILVNMVKQGKKIPTDFVAGAEAESKSTYENVKKEIKEEKRNPPRRDLSVKEVCGVPLLTDAVTLDDPAKSFAHFKEHYPNNGALEENKALLKQKYALAKKTGEVVNKARNEINYAKKSIESLRRERALEGLVGGEGAEEVEPHPEEVEHRKMIEAQKVVYKQNFTALRELKHAIEHIQRLLEKTRGKMQGDFDNWYKMCMHHQVKGGGNGGEREGEFKNSSEGGRGERRGQENIEPSQPKGGGDVISGSGAKAGYKDTGNNQTNDDIAAFFAAKEELIRKRNAGAK